MAGLTHQHASPPTRKSCRLLLARPRLAARRRRRDVCDKGDGVEREHLGGQATRWTATASVERVQRHDEALAFLASITVESGWTPPASPSRRTPNRRGR